MIRFENLSKTYGGNIQALRNVSLEIPATGMFGLLGVNGAGKTTLMRILAGLLEPSSGRACVLGNDLSTTRGRQATQALLGYLPQELGLYPDLTAREFLDYMAILKGVTSRTERREQIEGLLARVGLAEVTDRLLKTYSGGMVQRVGIAQALLGRPRLLIVDEPTAGLDPEERVRFRNLLADVAQHNAVILSTHIVEDIGQSCNDMAVLWQGAVLFRGRPGELIERARGQVWAIQSQEREDLDGSLVVVSTRQVAGGVLHRILGEPPSGYETTARDPRLEDGYLWLMNQARAAAN
jgi:ABC-2 type transport system ATP-binding protein